jgi:hypothetical protein
VRWLVVLGIVLASAPAAAEPPYILSADVGPRLGTTASFPRASATIARQWWDRLHVGLRIGAGWEPSFLAVEEAAELGLWLYPSRKTRLLLGWRLGHVYLRDTDGGGIVEADALSVESFAVIELKLGKVDLRVTPMVLTGYRKGTWLLSIGPEIGVSTWF